MLTAEFRVSVLTFFMPKVYEVLESPFVSSELRPEAGLFTLSSLTLLEEEPPACFFGGILACVRVR